MLTIEVAQAEEVASTAQRLRGVDPLAWALLLHPTEVVQSLPFRLLFTPVSTLVYFLKYLLVCWCILISSIPRLPLAEAGHSFSSLFSLC